MKTLQVRPGDCFTSIAFQNGFFWQTLWDHPDNKALRDARKDPFTLVPGVDSVVVPDPRQRDEACQTAKVHTFRRRGVPARLKIRLLHHDGTPRANEEYFLEVNGELVADDKRADGEGHVEVFIPNDARSARLYLDGGEEIVDLALGRLEPPTTLRGVQARLLNLGFYRGPIDGEDSAALADAMARFCHAEGLAASLSREAVFQKIEEAHAG